MAVHCSNELKRKKSFFILQSIKIIFVPLFFSIFLSSSGQALKQNTLNSLNSLKLSPELSPLYPAVVAADPRLRLDLPLGELSLSSSSTCLGFLIWVIGMINYNIC